VNIYQTGDMVLEAQDVCVRGYRMISGTSVHLSPLRFPSCRLPISGGHSPSRKSTIPLPAAGLGPPPDGTGLRPSKRTNTASWNPGLPQLALFDYRNRKPHNRPHGRAQISTAFLKAPSIAVNCIFSLAPAANRCLMVMRLVRQW